MVKGIVKNLQVINRITLRDEILCVRRIVDIFSLQTMITYPEMNVVKYLAQTECLEIDIFILLYYLYYSYSLNVICFYTPY